MADSNRRDFLKKGAKAVLGVGTVGAISGGLAAGCAVEPEAGVSASELGGVKLALNEAKYRQLKSFSDVHKEFMAALDEVADGLLADPAAYASFMEGTDAVASLRMWDRDASILAELAGDTDGTSKRGRLKRILAVSEMYDGATGLDAAYGGNAFGGDEYGGSSSSVSSGGDCATNGSATNGCCVIHTWGWSAGDGLC